MIKTTKLELSSEEMKEAVQAYLLGKCPGEVEFVGKNGFYPQTSYSIEVRQTF